MAGKDSTVVEENTLTTRASLMVGAIILVIFIIGLIVTFAST